MIKTMEVSRFDLDMLLLLLAYNKKKVVIDFHFNETNIKYPVVGSLHAIRRNKKLSRLLIKIKQRRYK